MLDNFASVADTVAALEKEPFTLVTANEPGEERLATLHLSISDATGDSAIVEYIDGEQVIHRGRADQVMTNSPIFSGQRGACIALTLRQKTPPPCTTEARRTAQRNI